MAGHGVFKFQLYWNSAWSFSISPHLLKDTTVQLEYAKDPVWANAEHTMIDITVRFAEIPEDLPFTASPNDCEAHGRAIFAAAASGEYGSVVEYLPPPAPTPEQLAEQARNHRNQLLADSDWTQLSDARAAMGAEKAAEWDSYRQALRDITAQPGFPTSIVWPAKPA
jgi:hypothetical protein